MMRIFVLVLQVGWRILKDYFTWMIKYAKHKERYPIALRFYRVQSLVRYVIGKMGVVYDETVNFEDIYSDDKKKLIVCNHQSMFDPLLFMIRAKRPLTFISKKEVKKFPFVGKILTIIDGEFLDRENIKTQVKTIMNAQRLVANQKYDVVIFPEGTRTKNPEEGMLPFHAGSFKIPFKANSDLVVTSIYGSFRVLKFFKYKKKKQLYVQFRVLKTFKYDELKEMNSVVLMEESRKIMEENMSIFIQKDIDYTKSIS